MIIGVNTGSLLVSFSFPLEESVDWEQFICANMSVLLNGGGWEVKSLYFLSLLHCEAAEGPRA